MFNQTRHRQRLSRAKNTAAPDADFLMRLVTEDMLVRLSAVNRQFEDAIALFGRTPFLAEAMAASPQIASVKRVEEVFCLGEADELATPTTLNLQPDSADLILAPLTLHWSDDLPGTLIQIQQALRPDGLLMAALPGPDTLYELRTALLMAESELSGGAARRVDAFTDIRDAGLLLQRAGFALPVVDQEVLTVRYDSVFDLVQDLRAFGVTAHLTGDNLPGLTRRIVARMSEIYADQFSDSDGRIRAGFSIVHLSGWAPHASQQQPLKPGSARSRLADALKTEEKKL